MALVVNGVFRARLNYCHVAFRPNRAERGNLSAAGSTEIRFFPGNALGNPLGDVCPLRSGGSGPVAGSVLTNVL